VKKKLKTAKTGVLFSPLSNRRIFQCIILLLTMQIFSPSTYLFLLNNKLLRLNTNLGVKSKQYSVYSENTVGKIWTHNTKIMTNPLRAISVKRYPHYNRGLPTYILFGNSIILIIKLPQTHYFSLLVIKCLFFYNQEQ